MDIQNQAKPTRTPRKILSETQEVEAFSALESTISPFDLRRVRDVPKRHLRLFKRAVLGVSTRGAAIRAFCQSCQGYEDLPSSVHGCKARTCPLWAFRPYQKTKEG